MSDREQYFVRLFGESREEAENYLKYNAPTIELSLRSIQDDFYIFHCSSSEAEKYFLSEFKDIEIIEIKEN